MKRILHVVSVITLVTFFTSLLPAQSLGEAARQLRKDRPATQAKRVITNDDIRSAPASSTAESPKPAASTVDQDKDEKDKEKEKPAAERVAQLNTEWQGKVNDQKKIIGQLERELDVATREYKLRAAAYYADAGNALRDPKIWAEQDRKYQAEISDKQKQLAEAKQKLADLQEGAHKAGAKVD